MTATFDLTRGPWIPCVMPSGERVELGIRDVLVRAHEVSEVLDEAPPVTAALHRLLLAIVHRNFGPRNEVEWKTVWDRGRFDAPTLDRYFDEWRKRFDLFDPERPFYQTPGLPTDKAVPISKLTFALASGNNATLFDHTHEGNCPLLGPGAAARMLVAHHAFAPGGLVSHADGEKAHKSADAAPLANTALALALQSNLFRTLLCNAPAYDPSAGVPFGSRGDAPSWEASRSCEPMKRSPQGLLDLLTWQSRRILLRPEEDGRVRSAIIMKGFQFGTDDRLHWEQMVAFVRNAQAGPTEVAWFPMGLRRERACWRDSQALMLTSEDDPHRQPGTLRWLGHLARAGHVDWRSNIPVSLLGMSLDKAKVNFWRHERVPLSAWHMGDRDCAGAAASAMDLAQRACDALRQSDRQVARDLLAAPSSSGGALNPSKEDVTALSSTFGTERQYWPEIEGAFWRFLEALRVSRDASEDERAQARDQAIGQWALSVTQAAHSAFGGTVRAMNRTANTLRACARGEGVLRRGLRKIMKPFNKEGSHAAGAVAPP